MRRVLRVFLKACACGEEECFSKVGSWLVHTPKDLIAKKVISIQVRASARSNLHDRTLLRIK